MSAKSRNKGRRVEQEAVNLLKAHGFDTARRTGEFVADDILVALDGRDWIIEVKARARMNTLYGWLEGRDAVLLKGDRKAFLILMDAERFLKLAGGV